MSITLFIGPMFSGKTSSVINELEKYNLAGISTLMIKYSKDIRYSDQNEIITHNNRLYSEKNGNIITLDDLKDASYFIYDMQNNIKAIGIDEFQFYKNHEVVNDWVKLGINIYLSALDGDYQAKIFENISYIIPYCDRIKKLHSICKKCKSFNGIFTSRTISNDQRVVIGGSELYTALCRVCATKKINL